MPTLVVAIEVEVQNRDEAMEFVEELCCGNCRGGYIYPVTYNGISVDEDMEDLR